MSSHQKETILNEIPRIGIIGMGVVGNAVAESYKNHSHIASLYKRDTKYPNMYGATYEELKTCDGIFVCVPSPSTGNGEYDTEPIRSVLAELQDYHGVIISKVTLTPDVYRELQQRHRNLVHVPEFLTAAKPTQDYMEAKFMIVGGSASAYIREAEMLIKLSHGGNMAFHRCSIEEAAMTKIAINSYLATKVIFMNELHALCQNNNIKYDTVAALMRRDHRIGNSHMVVPGPDGDYGFGGMCFPKDTAALLEFAERCDVDLGVLQSAVEKNTLLRLKNKP